MIRSLPANIEKNPRAAFLAIAGLHIVVWTALPAALFPNLPLDLIEALIYGREWQFGYDKLPPLPWWLVEVLHIAVGRDFAYYAFSQTVVIAAFAAVWATAMPLVGPLGALGSILILDSIHYFNFTAVKFNHDVVQLPFWALAGFAFREALRGGRLLHWIILGASTGLALWAKYFIVILAAPMIFFIFFDREARKTLMTPGPWIAAAAAIAVMSPHLVWLVQNDFLPFAYANARAAPSRGIIDHARYPIVFALSQIFLLLPALFVVSPLYIGQRPNLQRVFGDYDGRIITLLALGPCATALALSAITGRGLIPMWGYPLWLFLGVWLIMLAGRNCAHFKRMVTGWGIVSVGYVVIFVVSYTIVPHFDNRFYAINYPGEALAREVSQRFRAATGRPLAYVIANMWDGGNVGHYAPERPRVLIDGKPGRAPWIDLADLKAKGAVVIWTGQSEEVPKEFLPIAPNAQVQAPLWLSFQRADSDRIERFGWAIVPPLP